MSKSRQVPYNDWQMQSQEKDKRQHTTEG